MAAGAFFVLITFIVSYKNKCLFKSIEVTLHYPLFIQSDKVILIARFISDYTYHYQMT